MPMLLNSMPVVTQLMGDFKKAIDEIAFSLARLYWSTIVLME